VYVTNKIYLLQIEQEKLASLKKIDEKENKDNRERESPRRWEKITLSKIP
jgi:hypothetical protein